MQTQEVSPKKSPKARAPRNKTARQAATDAEESSSAEQSAAQPQGPKEAAPAQPQGASAAEDQKQQRHLLPHVKLVRDTLQGAGWRPVGNVEEIGNDAWIECLPPADTGNLSNYDLVGRASWALRQIGSNVRTEDIRFREIAGRLCVLVPVRLATERAYEPNAEMLTFRPLPGGGVGAESPFSSDALLNTRDRLVRLLKDVRLLVRKEKTISPADLANRFAGTILASAADHAHWVEWREKFAAGELTAKNAALVLLKDTTGTQEPSLEVRLSRTRTKRKVQETGAN